jgi:hypothetical protein
LPKNFTKTNCGRVNDAVSLEYAGSCVLKMYYFIACLKTLQNWCVLSPSIVHSGCAPIFRVLRYSISRAKGKIFTMFPEWLYAIEQSIGLSLTNWLNVINSLFTVADVNECAINTHNCHDNATCNNTHGSFTCACNNGFTGDGVNCAGMWNEPHKYSINCDNLNFCRCLIQWNLCKYL